MTAATVFLDFASVDAGDLDRGPLERAAGGAIAYHATTAPVQLAERVAAAKIVLLNKIAADAAFFAAAPRLEMLCVAATGTDNIDLDTARQRGVVVSNIRGYCTDSVAQHVFALILSLTRRLDQYRDVLRGDAWRHRPQFCLPDFPVPELTGQTLVIVGGGVLGSAVARLGEAFGMRVIVTARPGADEDKRPPLADVLPSADVLSLHCPLTPRTAGLLGAAQFAALKPTAIVINTARGALIDAEALLSALHNGDIAGAGIDVLAQEPPVDGDPLLEARLPNLIVTPHVAWAAREARQRALDEMALNLEAFRRGRPRNRVS